MTKHNSYEQWMSKYIRRQDRRTTQAELDRIRASQGADEGEAQKLTVKKFRRPWWW